MSWFRRRAPAPRVSETGDIGIKVIGKEARLLSSLLQVPLWRLGVLVDRERSRPQ